MNKTNCLRERQHTSCCLGDPFEILLQNPPDRHGSCIHKVLKTHVVDAPGGEDDVGTGRQDFLDPLLGDVGLSEATKSTFHSRRTAEAES